MTTEVPTMKQITAIVPPHHLGVMHIRAGERGDAAV